VPRPEFKKSRTGSHVDCCDFLVEKVKKKILGRKLSRQEKNDKRRLKLKMVYN